jgi:hypothetical protein
MSNVSFKNPHAGQQVTLEAGRGADSYDQSAMPTPFLIGGFAPGTKPSQIKQQQKEAALNQSMTQLSLDQPRVSVKAQPKLTAPISVVYAPPSLNIPSSANMPDPIQVRPRSRSSHEATSPRAAVVSPRSKPQVTQAAVPEPKTRIASPLHADAGFMDFFSSAPSSRVNSTATTASSSPVVTARTLHVSDSDESDDEEERARQKAARKAARKAAKKAEAEREAAAAALKEKERAEREKASSKKSKKPAATTEQLAQAAKWLAEADFYWCQHEADLSSSTGFGFTKHQVTWRFVLDDRLHELELFHSKFSGKRRIRLDSVELVNEKVLFDGGSSHEIFIGEHLLEVVIFIEKSPLTFGYDLMIEGLAFQRAKRKWIQETQQRLTGTQFESKDLKAKKKEKFARETDMIDEDETSYATTAIKRKSKQYID